MSDPPSHFQEAVEKKEEVLHLTFNTEFTCLSLCTSQTAFHMALHVPERPERMKNGVTPHGVVQMSRLGTSSLVALVLLQAPRKLRVLHISKLFEICNHTFKDTILGVKLTRTRMIVVTENAIYIHSLNNMKVLHAISTNPNPRGIMTISSGPAKGEEEGVHLLAFPASETKGQIHVFDANKFQTKRLFQGFEQPLAFLKVNNEGALLAAASVEGTYVLVFEPLSGECVYRFYRGFHSVEVFDINFSKDSVFLTLSTSSSTVHIFKLQKTSVEEETKKSVTEAQSQQIQESRDLQGSSSSALTASQESASSDGSNYYNLNSWIGWAKSTITAPLGQVLPESISDSLLDTGKRAFATAQFPSREVKKIATVVPSYDEEGPVLRLIVVGFDGIYYVYKINELEGGECELLKQMKLVELE